MSVGKLGKPRPDVRLRVAAMHADRETKYRWGVALAKGRARHMTTKATTKMLRRWNGKLNALLAGRVAGRKRGYTEDQVGLARALHRRDSNIGRIRLARLIGVSEDQARAILDELRDGLTPR